MIICTRQSRVKNHLFFLYIEKKEKEMKEKGKHIEKKYNFRTETARDRFLDWCMKAAPLFESSRTTSRAPPRDERTESEQTEYTNYSELSDEYQPINKRYNLRHRSAPRPSAKNPDRIISSKFPTPGGVIKINFKKYKNLFFRT